MCSNPTTPSSLKRDYINYCIDGWLDDQSVPVQPRRTALPTEDDMDASPETPTGAPKRQRTSESRWADRVSRLERDGEPPSSREFSIMTDDSRFASISDSDSYTLRRSQLAFMSPAIFFGPSDLQIPESDDATFNTSLFSAQSSDPSISQRVTMMTFDPVSQAENDNVQVSMPSEVCKLIKRFSEEAANPNLPLDMVAQIKMMSPTECLPLPRAALSPPSTVASQRLLRYVCVLFNLARNVYAGSENDVGWHPLMRRVLVGPPGATILPFIKYEDAVPVVVDSDLLPQEHDEHIETVIADHLLQFNAAHRQVAHVCEPVFQSQPPPFSLSAFDGSVASKTLTCAVVEVRAPGGEPQEASYRVGVASAAILEKVRLLGGETGQAANAPDYMPVIGWVVHGHFWTLHVSYRQADGSIRVLGPYPSGNTATFLGVYRLIRIVQEVKNWGREIYFPYLAAKLSKLAMMEVAN